MAFISSGNTKPPVIAPPKPQQSSLQQYLAKGYTIINDGPSGVQLLAPRNMRVLDVICLAVGVFTGLLVHPLIGLFFIACALIDYFWLVKRDTVFLPRQ